MFDIFINFNISCLQEKIVPTKRPNFPAAKKKYNKYTIPGRDGDLYEDTGFYEDIVVPIEFNYISDINEWHSCFRRYKKLFLNAKTIQLSDDAEVYYKVKKVEIGTNERKAKRIGKFEVQITCDPYAYLIAGKEPISINGTITNNYERSMPIYYVYGNGTCYLNVNGTECKCNVTDCLIIDVEKQLSYREDGFLQNSAINQDYDLLHLNEDDNTITISDGFTLKVIPNWRCK